MNSSSDIKWYIDERINEAHKAAENQRLARVAKGEQLQQPGNPLQMCLVTTMTTLLKSRLWFQHPHTDSRPSPVPHGIEGVAQ